MDTPECLIREGVLRGGVGLESCERNLARKSTVLIFWLPFPLRWGGNHAEGNISAGKSAAFMREYMGHMYVT